MRVILYARVSKEETDPQGKRYQEPENQLEPMREYCKSMDWEIIQEFVDRKSGGDSNRPAFKEMLGLVRQHRFDLLLVWNLDRFSREEIFNSLAYIQTLKQNNVRLRSYSENLDTGEMGDTGEILIIIMLWMAQKEREKISKRTKAGIQRRKNLGVWKGGRPFK